MKAILKNYRQAPRKVRLIADSVRGKKVSRVLVQLSFIPKRAGASIKKLVESALANAKQKKNSLTSDTLVVDSIVVQKGITLKRWTPRAHGRSSRINKRGSHVTVVLKEQPKKS
jgi:large subunit ribosomal protein L22